MVNSDLLLSDSIPSEFHNSEAVELELDRKPVATLV